MKLAPPVNGRLGPRFGQRGSLWSSGRHTGLDFMVPIDTPVRASASGTLTLTPGHPAYGIYQEINHGNGVATLYAHLSRKVKASGPVAAGEIIGYSGVTGNTTGPHVHFEVKINGAARDPELYLSGTGTVPGGPKTGGDFLPDTGTHVSFDNVSDPNTWLRIGMFIGGAALAAVGGYIVVRNL